jgi:NAD(P)-dependent dehydrogenase (short-subunit alcohol dehydrogenase family)
MSQELAPLGIATTLIEPGAARTNSSTTSVDPAPALEPYAELRAQLLASFAEPIGDPVKVAHAIIAAADVERPPRRLLLGSDAYEHVQAALSTRLREVEAQVRARGGPTPREPRSAPGRPRARCARPACTRFPPLPSAQRWR